MAETSRQFDLCTGVRQKASSWPVPLSTVDMRAAASIRQSIEPAQQTLFASPSLVGAARGDKHADAYWRATSPAKRRTSTRSASVASPLAHAQASCGTSTGAGAGKHRNAACSTRLIRNQRPFSSLRSLARSVPASTTAAWELYELSPHAVAAAIAS